jgi:hypothetical protein
MRSNPWTPATTVNAGAAGFWLPHSNRTIGDLSGESSLPISDSRKNPPDFTQAIFASNNSLGKFSMSRPIFSRLTLPRQPNARQYKPCRRGCFATRQNLPSR